MKKQLNLLIYAIIFVVIAINLISAVSVTGVSSNPTEVVPGKVINVEIRIKNIYTYDVSNLNIKLDLSNVPFAPYQSSSEDYVDELKDDKTENFNFQLIALPSATSGIYKIPIEITYEDADGNISSKSELISLIVNSAPELKISLEEIVLIKGQENRFFVKVINSGLSDVKFVYMSVNNIIGLRFLTEKEQYLGDVNSDDFESAEYNVYIDETASNIATLTVTLKFKDATNKEFTQVENLILKVYSLKEAQELGLIKKQNIGPYFIIFILIIIYILYRIIKKRNKNKKKSALKI